MICWKVALNALFRRHEKKATLMRGRRRRSQLRSARRRSSRIFANGYTSSTATTAIAIDYIEPSRQSSSFESEARFSPAADLRDCVDSHIVSDGQGVFITSLGVPMLPVTVAISNVDGKESRVAFPIRG